MVDSGRKHRHIHEYGTFSRSTNHGRGYPASTRLPSPAWLAPVACLAPASMVIAGRPGCAFKRQYSDSYINNSPACTRFLGTCAPGDVFTISWTRYAPVQLEEVLANGTRVMLYNIAVAYGNITREVPGDGGFAKYELIVVFDHATQSCLRNCIPTLFASPMTLHIRLVLLMP